MKTLLRFLGLVLLGVLALQIYFLLRIAAMAVVNPESTAFQRSEVWLIGTRTGALPWRQQWVPYADIADSLKRAVIASEDATFLDHDGVDVEALEKAWDKNAKAEERAAQQASRLAGRRATPAATPPAPALALVKPARIIGGSTITQQLAKNLFLSGERTLLRKGQELVLTVRRATLLSKRRILEIYLNSVEWGEGVFGAEAAAQQYLRKNASRLNPLEAARLAVMLPRPKYFQTRLQSGYLNARASTIAARMAGVDVP